MKRKLKSFFLHILFISVLQACDDDEKTVSQNGFTKFEGKWKLIEASLDQASELWVGVEFEITILNDSTIEVITSNIPLNREKIWPSTNMLNFERKASVWIFSRADGIDINISIIEDNLLIGLHPPRSWSYSEECQPPDVNSFQCSNEGQWSLFFEKK